MVNGHVRPEKTVRYGADIFESTGLKRCSAPQKGEGEEGLRVLNLSGLKIIKLYEKLMPQKNRAGRKDTLKGADLKLYLVPQKKCVQNEFFPRVGPVFPPLVKIEFNIK